jgi:hypothetical protein
VASQTQFDGHSRKTPGTGGAASEIETAKELPDSGAITQAEFDAIKANAVGSASGVGRPSPRAVYPERRSRTYRDVSERCHDLPINKRAKLCFPDC